MRKVTESNVEDRLVSEVKKIGGLAYKFESSSVVGVPDRIAINPKGKVFFIELKKPGKKPRKRQVFQMNKLEEMGCEVRVISSYQEVEKFIKELL